MKERTPGEISCLGNEVPRSGHLQQVVPTWPLLPMEHGCLPAGPRDLDPGGPASILSPDSLRAWPWAPGWVPPGPGCYVELHDFPPASV